MSDDFAEMPSALIDYLNRRYLSGDPERLANYERELAKMRREHDARRKAETGSFNTTVDEARKELED